MLTRRVRERAPAVILALGLVAMAGLVTVVSVSAGANVWTRLGGPNITGGNVTALAVEPTTSGTAYAVVNPPGSESIYWGQVGKVFRTTNGGATWTPVYTPQVRLESLAVTGPDVYVAGWGHQGLSSIYHSDDAGASWNGVYTTTGSWNNFYALAIDPTDADNVYAAGMETTVADPYAYYGAVCHSDDGGVNWTQALTVPNSAYFYSLAVNPVTPTIILAGGWGGNAGCMYRTEDSGLNWTEVYTVPGYHVFSLAFHPLTPTLAYAASGWPGGPMTLYRSENGGVDWTEVLSPTAGPFALEPPNTIYVAEASGDVWKSTDRGDHWDDVGDSPGDGECLAIDLGLDRHLLYAGLYDRGVHTATTDSPETWTEANNGIEISVIPRVIAVDPERPDYLYTAGGYPGCFRSTDAGASWHQLSDVPYLYSFAIHPVTTSIVYAGGDNDQGPSILRSSDSGVSWTGVYTSPDLDGRTLRIRALAIDPIAPTTIYAGAEDWTPLAPSEALILRSDSGGEVETWTEVYTRTSSWSGGFDVLAINPLSTSIVYAAHQDCTRQQECTGDLYRTTDSGQSWTLVLTSTLAIRSLAIDRWNPSIVYAANANYNVQKSTDGGDNWDVIVSCPPPCGDLLALDPRVPSYLYLAGMGWVGRSSDGGDTWENLNAGLPWSIYPTAFALDTSSSITTPTLYLGANGVWAYNPRSALYLPLVLKGYAG